jgi:hypothetical protein
MPPPTSSRAYTRNQQWRLSLTAWRTSLFVYNAIGATLKAEHWEQVTVWLFVKKFDWVERPIQSIAVTAAFEGILPSKSAGAAHRRDARANASQADTRLWAAGVTITVDASAGDGLPDPGTASPGGGPSLDVRAVRAVGLVVVDGEELQLPEVYTQ